MKAFFTRLRKRWHRHYWRESLWNELGHALEEKCACGETRHSSYGRIAGFHADWQPGTASQQASGKMKIQLIIGRWCLRFRNPDTGLFRWTTTAARKHPEIRSADWRKLWP